MYDTKKEYPDRLLRNSDHELYNRMKAEYSNDQSELEAQFRKDALDEVGLTGHPKADKAYLYAWNQGHSAGYSEILCYLQDIAEVLL